VSTANESGLPEEPVEDARHDGAPAVPEPALEGVPASVAPGQAAGAEGSEPLEAAESVLEAAPEPVLEAGESAEAVEAPAAAEPGDAGEAVSEEEARAARERAAFDELVASFHTETAPDPVPRRIIRHTVLNTPPDWVEPIVEPADETTVDKYFPSEHYEPPEPPPLPAASGATKASWTLLVGGVLFLLLRTLLGWETEPWMFYLALASILGGIVSLFARMRPERDEYDDPDNGAVV
jgi:hypothetical protein